MATLRIVIFLLVMLFSIEDVSALERGTHQKMPKSGTGITVGDVGNWIGDCGKSFVTLGISLFVAVSGASVPVIVFSGLASAAVIFGSEYNEYSSAQLKEFKNKHPNPTRENWMKLYPNVRDNGELVGIWRYILIAASNILFTLIAISPIKSILWRTGSSLVSSVEYITIMDRVGIGLTNCSLFLINCIQVFSFRALSEYKLSSVKGFKVTGLEASIGSVIVFTLFFLFITSLFRVLLSNAGTSTISKAYVDVLKWWNCNKGNLQSKNKDELANVISISDYIRKQSVVIYFGKRFKMIIFMAKVNFILKSLSKSERF